ncbi:MAG TPA: hypothetical protein VFZ09_40060 [Archangium sp.]|nr:hypothetical protein [Archangium sp.]HEX5752469.1 hypothetical protein [Archangium sp.]
MSVRRSPGMTSASPWPAPGSSPNSGVSATRGSSRPSKSTSVDTRAAT